MRRRSVETTNAAIATTGRIEQFLDRGLQVLKYPLDCTVPGSLLFSKVKKGRIAMLALTAVVTGTTSGIGEAIARGLLKRGVRVAGIARRKSSITDDNYKHYNADICDTKQVEAVSKEIVADLDGVDILVNNAGIVDDRPLLKMPDESWERVINTDMTGVMRVTRAFLPSLLRTAKTRGHTSIINIGSVVGTYGHAMQSNYAAAKGGVIGFTLSLADELGGRGIRCNAVTPGFIDTAMTQSLPEAAKEVARQAIPLARGGNKEDRFGRPEDVASAVAFLASDDAAYITGVVLPVTGGM